MYLLRNQWGQECNLPTPLDPGLRGTIFALVHNACTLPLPVFHGATSRHSQNFALLHAHAVNAACAF